MSIFKRNTEGELVAAGGKSDDKDYVKKPTRPYDRKQAAAPSEDRKKQAKDPSAPTRTDDDDANKPASNVRAGTKLDQGAYSADTDGISDPVVGWLVIIKGPGRGSALPLGYGKNFIGRAEDQKICLNFGDEEISRQNHAMIAYDPSGRSYYLKDGSGSNLTYLGGKPILGDKKLIKASTIRVGKTHLRFVPLCDAEFDWQDE